MFCVLSSQLPKSNNYPNIASHNTDQQIDEVKKQMSSQQKMLNALGRQSDKYPRLFIMLPDKENFLQYFNVQDLGEDLKGLDYSSSLDSSDGTIIDASKYYIICVYLTSTYHLFFLVFSCSNHTRSFVNMF